MNHEPCVMLLWLIGTASDATRNVITTPICLQHAMCKRAQKYLEDYDKECIYQHECTTAIGDMSHCNMFGIAQNCRACYNACASVEDEFESEIE